MPALLRTFCIAAFACVSAAAAEPAKVVRVSSSDELLTALTAARPGTRIEVAPGEYTGGLRFENLKGAAGSPIVVTGADPQKLPRFTGGPNSLHLVNPVFVELHNLELVGWKANGVSIDDGGAYSQDPRGIVLKGLRISNNAPRGNFDAIKLSGIHGFRVEDCVLENWGVGSGSAIDMVGCHDGVVSGCTFRHRPDVETTGGSGVQAKGGSGKIVIRRNRFENAGQRAVNLGGSTGAAYFRPPLTAWPANLSFAEAHDLTVESNTFIGSLSPIVFAGVDGATVKFNTIYQPDRWALRILQENREPNLVPCQNGVFTDNIIAFQSGKWASGGVNIGGGTSPNTFRFARNHWYCLDQPARSAPTLPTPELAGTQGTDPQFVDEAKLDLRLKAGSPAKGRGMQEK